MLGAGNIVSHSQVTVNFNYVTVSVSVTVTFECDTMFPAPSIMTDDYSIPRLLLLLVYY